MRPGQVPTIADAAFGLIMCPARRFPQADHFVRTGQWKEGGFLGGLQIWVAERVLPQTAGLETDLMER